MTSHVLAVNAGSSSLKLAVFDIATAVPSPVLRARLETRGRSRRLDARDALGAPVPGPPLRLGRRTSAGTVPAVLDWLEDRLGGPIAAAGHRVVHGGPDLTGPTPATPEVLTALEDLAPLAPLHQAPSLAAVRALWRARPGLAQALAFDTAFHCGHEPVVDRLGLPQAWAARGLRRYGFHGLSYAYVAARLAELDPEAANGRVLAAHLGSGASLCAIRAGRSVDTTMGATPLDGLLMGTRCGALDPGVVLYLQQAYGLDAAALTDMLYRRSGLLGVSGLSSDMRDLLRSPEAAARAAIDLFVFRIAREAAALSGTLGGLDALVFTAGVGENAPEIRAAVCARLAWLGVRLDPAANARGTGKISASRSRVSVWIIPTDEEQVIARDTRQALAHLFEPGPGRGEGSAA